MSKKLTKGQENFLEYLLTATSIKEASELAGISINTAYKYNQNPLFKEAYRKRRAEIMQQTSTVLQRATGLAVKTLIDIMEDTTISPYARQQSAQTVLNLAYKSYENEDILQAIEELKKVVESDE